MAYASDYNYQVFIYRRSDGKYLSFSGCYNDLDSRVSGRQYAHIRNKPKTVNVVLDNSTDDATKNILSSTCALWSGGGTGAVAIGDLIYYMIDYVNSPGAPTGVFYGIIESIDHQGSGYVKISAIDHLEVEQQKTDVIEVFSSVRDRAVKDYSTSEGLRYISGVTETSIVEPLIEVGFATAEYGVEIGTNVNSEDLSDSDDRVAQAFVAEREAFLGCTFRDAVSTSGTHPDETMTCSLCENVSEDNRPGLVIASKQISVNEIPTIEDLVFDFIGTVEANAPVWLVAGKRYWLVLQCTCNNFHYGIIYGDPSTGAVIDNEWTSGNAGVSWTPHSGRNLYMYIDQVDYDRLEYGSQYTVDQDDNKIYLAGSVSTIAPTTHHSYTYYHGLASYYYGTVTHQDIVKAILKYNTGLTEATSSNESRTWGYYSTRGKRHLKALQEVMDMEETGGTWAGRTHAISTYLDGSPYAGTVKTIVSKTPLMSDSAYATFSHGPGASDSHARIKATNLSQTIVRRASGATVTGKGGDGKPLGATSVDRALSGSYGNNAFALADHLVEHNEELHSQEELDARAETLRNRTYQNVWEGNIEVSGAWPDLMDITPASETYGAGVIIAINDYRLGISNVKFRVLGVVVKETSTVIYVSNLDIFFENRQRLTIERGERNESFLAAVGTLTDKYVWFYSSTVVTTSELWMELEDASGDLPAMHRIKCKRFASSLDNTNKYNAVFDAFNGYCLTSKIKYIKLYDAKTGGTLKATITLLQTGPPAVDMQFWKYKATRLIVDAVCAAS